MGVAVLDTLAAMVITYATKLLIEQVVTIRIMMTMVMTMMMMMMTQIIIPGGCYHEK